MTGEPTLIVALADSLAWLSSLWAFVMLAVGFSFVIFVHELGHFLAAKWAKVRVERFAIGFGRPILAYRKGIGLCVGSTQQEYDRQVERYAGDRMVPQSTDAGSDEPPPGPSGAERARAAKSLGLGETEYCFNILPLGGYVKMLGQEDFVVDKSGELKVKADPDSFTNKSIGTRMVIISAGVIMNLLFAAIAFAIVVMVGRLEIPAIAGQVTENSPAGRAGMQTGDKVFEINGTKIRSFSDMMMRVLLSDPDEELELIVERNGKIIDPPLRILPVYKKDQKVRQIGMGQPSNRRVWYIPLRSNAEPLPWELREKDELYGVVIDGEAEELTDIGDFSREITAARGAPVDIVVKRPTDPESLADEMLLEADPDIDTTEATVQVRAVWAPLSYAQTDDVTGSLLGLVPRMTVVFEPDLDRSFEKAGVRRGDVITKIGPHASPSFKELREAIQKNPDTEVPIEVSRTREANHGLAAQTVEFCVKNRETLIVAALEDVSRAMEKAVELADAEGLPDDERDVLLTKLREAGDGTGWRAWLENVDVHRLDPLVPRRPFALFKDLPPTVDAKMRCLDEDHLVVADVIQKFGDRITPAQAAGIPRGAVILAVDGQPVTRWYQLSETFRAKAGQTVALTYRVADDIRHTKMAIPNCVSAALDLPPGARVVRINGKAKHPIEVEEGKTRDITLPDWRVTEGLLKESIGATLRIEHVTVDGQKRTTEYAVTPDNTDPWLHRAVFVASFVGYPLRERNPVHNPILAVGVGFRQAYQATMHTLQTIRHMVLTRKVGVEKVSGPVGIIRIGSQAAGSGVINLLWFLAIISANLAVINFLPMPIVDGGLFLFLILEKIRGEPVSIKTQIATQLIGIALIATLFILITYQDVKNWILGA